MHLAIADSSLPLGINPLLLLAQLINFGILFYILNRFAFPALLKTLDERSATIRKGVEDAARAEAELQQAQQQGEAILTEKRQQGQQAIADAMAAAERVRVQLEAEAKAQANDILVQAQQRIRQEEAASRNALRQQVADLAINAASTVVGESLDGPKQRRLVEEFITKSEVK